MCQKAGAEGRRMRKWGHLRRRLDASAGSLWVLRAGVPLAVIRNIIRIFPLVNRSLIAVEWSYRKSAEPWAARISGAPAIFSLKIVKCHRMSGVDIFGVIHLLLDSSTVEGAPSPSLYFSHNSQ